MKVMIASACRTAIGKMSGSLSSVPAADLGAAVISEAVKRANLTPDLVDYTYMGSVLQAGLGQNIARQAAIKAGVPQESPAVTINVVCGSGLESVNMAARLIKSGEADIVVAGGVESMSGAPYLLPQARAGYRMGHGEIYDSMIKDALWDAFGDYHMGITAENVAEKWRLSREELDEFAAGSQQKAENAIGKNRFADEIIPIEIKAKKESVVFDTDESVRFGTTEEKLSALKPAFKKDGIVTAGNSSGISDGAAAVVLISEKKAAELKIKPLAVWSGGAIAGIDPAYMGIGPVYSTKKLLDRLSLKIEDIDLFEANEAFAAQSIAVMRELNVSPEKVNVNGGAIALGHPVGASGCRILVTLLHEMQKRDVRRGVATLCVGGGMGVSTAVERE